MPATPTGCVPYAEGRGVDFDCRSFCVLSAVGNYTYLAAIIKQTGFVSL